MLQQIRSWAQGWIAWAVVAVLIFVFVLWGASGYLAGSSEGDVVAEINGSKITQNDVQLTYERLVQQQQMAQLMAGIQTPMINEQAIRNQAIQQLVLEKVLTKAAKSEGFSISRQQVDNLLSNMPQFQVDGQFSPEQYERLIRQLNFTPNGFRQVVQNEMLITQAESTIVDSVFLLPYELQNTIALVNQTRDIDYAVFKASDFYGQLSLTDEDIQGYYNTHQSEFMMPETVNIAYILMDKSQQGKKLKSTLSYTEQDIKDFYDTHISQFTVPERRSAQHILIAVQPNATTQDLQAAKEKAQDLTDQIKAGASFAQLAEKYSQDPGSASKGGDLGFFSRGEMVPAFEEAVFTSKVGDIAGPIQTEFGYHIIQVNAIQAAEVTPFEDVKDQLVQEWYSDHLDEQFESDLAELDRMAFVEPESLETLGESFDLKVQTMTLSKDPAANKDLGQNPAVVQTAFSDDVLLDRQNSGLLRLSNNQAMVFKVVEHTEPKLKPLDDVKAELKETLMQRQGLLLVREKAREVIEQFNAKLALNEIAAQDKFTWKPVKALARQNPDVPYEIVQAAFALPVADTAQITGLEIFPDQVAVVVVENVNPGQLDKDFEETMLMEFQQGLAQFKGRRDYSAYLSHAKDSVKVKMKD